jgi:hygromycin-B 7''-O-kinase
VAAEFELDPALAGRLVAVAGVQGRADSVLRLAGGISGSVFAVRAGTREVVLKLYRVDSGTAMQKEVSVYELLARRAPGLPVPTLLAADDSARLVPQSFVVLTKLEGRPLRSLAVTERELIEANRQLGATLRELHRVTLAAFGDVVGGAQRFGTNREFMLARFDASLREFERLGGDPRLRPRLEPELEMRADLFDRCDDAVLCHNDGHDANVLVVASPTGWSLSGLLDFENALAGDPLLDLAKTYEFSERRSDAVLAALVDGYGLEGDWRGAFDLYLIHHRLELWNLLARLGVTERLPAIAATLATDRRVERGTL